MNELSEIDEAADLLDMRGSFEAFLGFFDHMVDERFPEPANRHSIVVDADPQALIDGLQRFERVGVPK